MKYLILITVSMLLNSLAYADCTTETSSTKVDEKQEIKTDVPNFLKGAKIIVRLANGKETEVPAEKFKVVPRLQQFIITKTSNETTKSCEVVRTETQYTTRKNRMSLGAGEGPTGHLSQSVSGNVAEIESQVGAVGAIQYQRMLNDRFSVGVQGQSNKSGLINVGLDF